MYRCINMYVHCDTRERERERAREYRHLGSGTEADDTVVKKGAAVQPP